MYISEKGIGCRFAPADSKHGPHNAGYQGVTFITLAFFFFLISWTYTLYSLIKMILKKVKV